MNRDFKGVWIPKDIWLDTSLSVLEKVLLVEIDSLDNDPEKGCFASNEYLGEFIGKSPGTVANMISSLRKRGYLATVFWDGRMRGLRLSQKNESSVHESVKSDFTDPFEQRSRIHESSVHESVNILIQDTNTINNTVEEIKDNVALEATEAHSKKVKEKIEDPAAIEVIEYLNELAGRAYKSSGPLGEKNRKLASALLKKFSIEDVKEMIELKVFQWKDDAKMTMYLRPSTVFARGEEYCQELDSVKKNPKLLEALKNKQVGGRMKPQTSAMDAIEKMLNEY